MCYGITTKEKKVNRQTIKDFVYTRHFFSDLRLKKKKKGKNEKQWRRSNFI